MKKKFSKMWKSSRQARKQRKYVHNAPLHIKHKLTASTLSKELRKEYSIRSVPVKKGDVVKIRTGQFKGKTGKVTKVSVKRIFAHVDCAVMKRADDTEAHYPIHPSNLEIIKLNMDDKYRASKIERAKK